MRSVYVIVMDSVGVGAAPDAERFGDAGADTFSHVIEGEDLSQIDLLLSLGMKSCVILLWREKLPACGEKCRRNLLERTLPLVTGSCADW